MNTQPNVAVSWPTARKSMHTAVKGFSLIELMISIVIGLVLIAGVIGIFIASKRNYNQDSQITPMQDNLRFAMALLQQNIEMAGFWSSVFVPTAISLDPSFPAASTWTDCGGPTFSGFLGSAAIGYSTSTVSAMSANNPVDGAAASSIFPCLDASEFQPGTDVLFVRRLLGAPVADADLVSGHVYLRENGTEGVMFKMGASAPVVNGTLVQTWAFDASVFYIRNFYQTANDSIPTLCRKYLSMQGGNLAWVGEPLAPGIENLQVQFGINTDPSTGLRPKYMTSNPSTIEQAQVVTTRISLLSRSTDSVASYTNNKTYNLADAPVYVPGDHHYRKVLESTFVLRNPSSLQFYQAPH